jgi:hypothetical protein
MTRIDAWVDQHGGKIVSGLLTVVVSIFTAWGTVNAQLASLEARKAERSEVVIALDSVNRQLRSLNVTLSATVTEARQLREYLCHGKEEQLGCQK